MSESGLKRWLIGEEHLLFSQRVLASPPSPIACDYLEPEHPLKLASSSGLWGDSTHGPRRCTQTHRRNLRIKCEHEEWLGSGAWVGLRTRELRAGTELCTGEPVCVCVPSLRH